MKFRFGVLFQLGLLLLSAGTTSCVQTWPADREFQTHPALYDEDQETIDETLTVDEAINRIYGIDFLLDNIKETCKNLGVEWGHPHFVHADALAYDYRFDGKVDRPDIEEAGVLPL